MSCSARWWIARPRRPVTYPDRQFLKALVIMIVRHLHSPNELLTALVYQLTHWRRHERGLKLRVCLDPVLKAA